MRRELWDPLEQALDAAGIRPIVGVIPDNRDAMLHLSPADPRFWDRVRSWQRKGWSIAMHGLHHVYHAVPKGSEPLLPASGGSEFVGLSLEVQRKMIRRSQEIFTSESVKPDLFMAPAHSLDSNTLLALEAETTIRVISDGHSVSPYREAAFTWIPQQIWHLRYLPNGVWTVCLHPNTMSRADLQDLVETLPRYRPAITELAAIQAASIREKDVLDRLVARIYAGFLELKRSR
jgi:peptidoglycan/xylan/chitin deacetylase (PgdA/CDA1 family)